MGTALTQWRRSVTKYGGGQGHSGQAIKLFQITPNDNDFQTLKVIGNIYSSDFSQQSRFLTACRRVEKFVYLPNKMTNF